MKIPFRFTTKDITEEDLRNAQRNLLRGELTDDDIKNLDAVISYMARNVLLHNVEGESK
jgi:hypothetical protein